MAYLRVSFNPLANCYAYAANCLQPAGNNRAIPGRQSGHGVTPPYNAATLTQACINDGCQAVAAGNTFNVPPAAPANHHLIAVMIAANGTDYHFYRQGPLTAAWTHKPGPHDASNYDGGLVEIGADLSAANHTIGHNTYVFVCYLAVPTNGLQVAG
ncbi:MAG: hypothetical protein OEY43_05505 [Gammaproteobacteria bacterium]|nr:hypothetical protein [Gammaproteobacteria bacterium]